MRRPEHVVLAGATGRLLARVGLTAHTRWETDEHVIKAALAVSRDLGRPVTGPELHDLWEAAHTTYTQTHPAELQHVEDLLHRVGRAYAQARDSIQAAVARNTEREQERRGLFVLRGIAATASPYAADCLPSWLTDPTDESGALSELEEVWTW